MAQIGGTDRLHPSTFVAKWGLEVMDTPWLHHDLSLEPLVQWSPGISSAMLGTLAELHIISWAVWAFQDWHRNEEKNTCLVSNYWFSHHLLSLSALGRGLDGELGTDDVHFHPLWSLLQLLGQFDQPGSMGDGRGQWAGDVHKHARCGNVWNSESTRGAGISSGSFTSSWNISRDSRESLGNSYMIYGKSLSVFSTRVGTDPDRFSLLNIGFCIPILLARRQVHWRCPFCAPSSKVRCGCWRWPCFAPRWPARGCRSVGMLRSWSRQVGV